MSTEKLTDRFHQESLEGVDSVLGRMVRALGLDIGFGFAEALDVSRDTVKTWRRRGEVPMKFLTGFAQAHNLSLDYLRFGKTVHNEPLQGREDGIANFETQDQFASRMYTINQERALLAAMPLSDSVRERTEKLLTGDPARDGLLIAESLRYEIAGNPAVLTARESALVENYRAAPEDAKKALETTCAALAQSPGAIKKAG